MIACIVNPSCSSHSFRSRAVPRPGCPHARRMPRARECDCRKAITGRTPVAETSNVAAQSERAPIPSLSSDQTSNSDPHSRRVFVELIRSMPFPARVWPRRYRRACRRRGRDETPASPTAQLFGAMPAEGHHFQCHVCPPYPIDVRALPLRFEPKRQTDMHCCNGRSAMQRLSSGARSIATVNSLGYCGTLPLEQERF